MKGPNLWIKSSFETGGPGRGAGKTAQAAHGFARTPQNDTIPTIPTVPRVHLGNVG